MQKNDLGNFSQRAAEYRQKSLEVGWIGPREIFNLIAENVNIENKLCVLDLATGTGDVPELIKKGNDKAYIEGIDDTQEMIDIALAHNFIDKGVKASLTDEEILREISSVRRYDLVTCSGFVDQIDIAAVTKLVDAVGASISKVGGYFAFTFEAQGNQHPGFKRNQQHDENVLRALFENSGARIASEKALMPAYHKGKNRDIPVENKVWLVQYNLA